jgi:hypothetical protein
LNQTQDWNELNHLHFHHLHFSQLRFHEVCNLSMVLHFQGGNWIRSWLKREIIFSILNMNFWLILSITN